MKNPALKKRRKRQYEILDVVTIKAIKHAVALAIWTLLMAMPDDWRVNRKWLQKELGVGEDRLAGGIERLTLLGLWRNVPARDEATGRLTGSEVWIYDEVQESPRPVVSRAPVISDCRENADVLIDGFKTQNGKKKSTAAEGGVKRRAPARETRERLSCENVFGFEWHTAWGRYLPELRAVAILLAEGIDDADAARRIIAEWAAAGARGFDRGAANALVWLCRQRTQLVHTADGDGRLGRWA